ncbi:MAG: hypothetical protein ACHQJD_03610 [Thermoanaerobaculia bacterium]
MTMDRKKLTTAAGAALLFVAALPALSETRPSLNPWGRLPLEVQIALHRAVRKVSRPECQNVTVIHEQLHTLGLSENPPSSWEITKRVLQRCGR